MTCFREDKDWFDWSVIRSDLHVFAMIAVNPALQWLYHLILGGTSLGKGLSKIPLKEETWAPKEKHFTRSVSHISTPKNFPRCISLACMWLVVPSSAVLAIDRERNSNVEGRTWELLILGLIPPRIRILY